MKFEKFNLKKYLIGIGSFWAILLIIYIIRNKNHNDILEKPMYTIGKIYEIKEYTRVSDSYMYNYHVGEKELRKGISANSSNNLFIGTRYLVIFEKGKPKNAMLLPFLIVPDSILEAPSEGWKELPIPTDKKMIRHFLENY